MKMFCRLNESELKELIKKVIENLEPDKMVMDVSFNVASTRISGQENWTVLCSVEVETKGEIME